MRSVLFVSQHNFFEAGSGAARSLRDLFHLLAGRSWRCRVLCGTHFDGPQASMAQVVEQLGLKGRTGRCVDPPVSFALHRVQDGPVAAAVYQPGDWRRPLPLETGYPLLQILDQALGHQRPDVLMTYGGGWLGRGIVSVAQRHGVPVMFWLRNDQYTRGDLLESVAGAIVPSRWTREHYIQKLRFNVACHVIPSPIRLEGVVPKRHEPKHVTFVGARADKGVFVFAAIAQELYRRRPDIPVCVVVGRGKHETLNATPLASLPSVKIIGSTPQPRDFLGMTRMLVAPSLWQETFLRTAAEAMHCGIPTLGSSRGGISDTLGDTGFVLDLPGDLSPQALPPAEVIAPWVEAIIRLNDDEALYQRQRQLCMQRAGERFCPDQIVARHEEALEQVIAAAPAAGMKPEPLKQHLASLQRHFQQPLRLERFDGVETLPRELLP